MKNNVPQTGIKSWHKLLVAVCGLALPLVAAAGPALTNGNWSAREQGWTRWKAGSTANDQEEFAVTNKFEGASFPTTNGSGRRGEF